MMSNYYFMSVRRLPGQSVPRKSITVILITRAFLVLSPCALRSPPGGTWNRLVRTHLLLNEGLESRQHIGVLAGLGLHPGLDDIDRDQKCVRARPTRSAARSETQKYVRVQWAFLLHRVPGRNGGVYRPVFEKIKMAMGGGGGGVKSMGHKIERPADNFFFLNPVFSLLRREQRRLAGRKKKTPESTVAVP